MSQKQRFLDLARHCDRMAEQLSDRTNRELLHETARNWRLLADTDGLIGGDEWARKPPEPAPEPWRARA